MYTVQEIASITGAKILQSGNLNFNPEHLLTDSRRLLFAEKSIFFALSSAQRSANYFVDDLYMNGVRAFMVDGTYPPPEQMPGASILQTDNVLLALQKLAAWHRRRFNFPVIGITGSNGKTIVKEWLYQLLYTDYHIIRNPKSYNSQIGVPLSIWPMSDDYNLGIFEAGISMMGEMEHLHEMIQPTLGVFTNIGTAHNEGFASLQQKIEEKSKLFTGANKVICSADDPGIYDALVKMVFRFLDGL